MPYPVEPYSISVGFNKAASYGPHEGIDLNKAGTSGNQDCGTPIKAIARGVCLHISQSTADYGNMAVVETVFQGVAYYQRYCHLQEITVRPGQTINVGDKIGTMGSTGNSTACHCHFDILKKKPGAWRFYTKAVSEWYVDPVWFIAQYKDTMTEIYKGYDLTNKDSMKVAVDHLVDIQDGKYSRVPKDGKYYVVKDTVVVQSAQEKEPVQRFVDLERLRNEELQKLRTSLGLSSTASVDDMTLKINTLSQTPPPVASDGELEELLKSTQFMIESYSVKRKA